MDLALHASDHHLGEVEICMNYAVSVKRLRSLTGKILQTSLFVEFFFRPYLHEMLVLVVDSKYTYHVILCFVFEDTVYVAIKDRKCAQIRFHVNM